MGGGGGGRGAPGSVRAEGPTPCDARRLLAAPDGLDTVGIFRLSADEAELRVARRALDAGAAYEEALRDAAGVLLAALIKAAPLARTIPLASVPFTAPLTNRPRGHAPLYGVRHRSVIPSLS